MGLLIVFIIVILIGVTVFIQSRKYTKKEGMALLFVTGQILNKSLYEKEYLTERDKKILNDHMGLFFNNDLVIFEDIKNQNGIIYNPRNDWTGFYVITFKKEKIIKSEYIENALLIESERNEIPIKVNSFL